MSNPFEIIETPAHHTCYCVRCGTEIQQGETVTLFLDKPHCAEHRCVQESREMVMLHLTRQASLDDAACRAPEAQPVQPVSSNQLVMEAVALLVTVTLAWMIVSWFASR